MTTTVPATEFPANVTHDGMANTIRALAMDAVQAANSGHPGMPMGMADVATVLFTRFLKFDANAPDWADRDRFVLSAGHGSMLIYALAYLTGYEGMSLEDLKNFRQLGHKTAGHPEWGHAPAVETTTGPLGQGLANAVGMALAEAHMAARYGSDLVDHHTYVIAGDGCLMEGISQEAIALAGHLKLSKLIVLFDDNNISIDGPVSLSDSTDQIARFEASGWEGVRVDGHDPEAVAAAIETARGSDKPSLIACRTTIGKGAPTKAGKASSHGAPLGDEEIAGARKALDWPHAPFAIPGELLETWRAAGVRGKAVRDAWEGRLAGASKRGEFEAAVKGDVAAPLAAAVEAHKKALADDPQKVATRKASQMALEAINEALPTTLGGSADLTGSNNTKTSQLEPLNAENYAGRYIHYGIREHGMAAAMNGMALHGGVVPYGGAFLVFSDYCRPSIRLAALMGIRSIFVMTHDSIGLGEDGPTHQPVEHVAALRAIPNLNVFRPGDVVETAECWELAMADPTTPSVLALTRQGLEQFRTEHVSENLCARGGYIVGDAGGDAAILASGSEVGLAIEAQANLKAEGISARVVSMPCWRLFDQQPEAYQESVLGDLKAYVGVEAAIRQGWDRYIGRDGGFVGMDSFGASGPGGAVYKHFGITAEAVAAEVKSKLGA